MSDYKCSHCGAAAYYDGRCGDGPVLMCKCAKRGARWVDEGNRGGYYTNPSGAHPVGGEGSSMRTDEIPDCDGCGYYDCIFCGTGSR